MIYVPLLKVRREEKNIIKELNYCFDNIIIPLLEIIRDEHNPPFKKDPITGNYVYEQNGKRRKRVREEASDENICILEFLNNLLKGKRAFIDFFRFVSKNYGGNKIDYNKVELSVKLNSSNELYKERVKEICEYENFIPVISIKPNFEISINE
ncbi:MAG: hypothetical protein EOL97_08020 [Spirochaetia bacterium]|nr:hypothetical protein [Spirochaetia bacterium]